MLSFQLRNECDSKDREANFLRSELDILRSDANSRDLKLSELQSRFDDSQKEWASKLQTAETALSDKLKAEAARVLELRTLCEAKDQTLETLRSDLKSTNEQIHCLVRAAAITAAASAHQSDIKSNSKSTTDSGSGSDQNSALRQLQSRFDSFEETLTASQKARFELLTADLHSERIRRKRYELWMMCGVLVVAVIFGVVWAMTFGPIK